MKNAGHSLAMAHPEFAEVQIENISAGVPSDFINFLRHSKRDNLSVGAPPDFISFLRHSARKHAEIFSCQTFTF